MTAETHISSLLDLESELGVGHHEDVVDPPSRTQRAVVLGAFVFSAVALLPPALQTVADTFKSIRRAASIFFPDLVPPGT
jgi:hypothetical protein